MFHLTSEAAICIFTGNIGPSGEPFCTRKGPPHAQTTFDVSIRFSFEVGNAYWRHIWHLNLPSPPTFWHPFRDISRLSFHPGVCETKKSAGSNSVDKFFCSYDRPTLVDPINNGGPRSGDGRSYKWGKGNRKTYSPGPNPAAAVILYG